jgi:hypothetical protein
MEQKGVVGDGVEATGDAVNVATIEYRSNRPV